MKEQEMVEEFHKAFDLAIRDTPGQVSPETAHLRIKLIEEELTELRDAYANEDLVAIADALGDLLYVVLGAAVSSGIPLGSVFAEIHRSNMSKVGGTKNEMGKLIKPPTYSPANLLPILLEASNAL